jgi:hypothetical protein
MTVKLSSQGTMADGLDGLDAMNHSLTPHPALSPSDGARETWGCVWVGGVFLCLVFAVVMTMADRSAINAPGVVFLFA